MGYTTNILSLSTSHGAQRFINDAEFGEVRGMVLGGEAKQPVTIVREETNVTSGDEVQQKLIHAGRTLAAILRGTLGPRGLDKGLYKTNGEFAITSDGARILNDLLIKNPGAKLLVSLGQSQESAIGDGVTSTVLFAGALLDEAGRLLRKGVHPLVLVDGYLAAAEIAISTLESKAFEVKSDDVESMIKVASTCLTGRSAGSDPRFAKMVVDALKHVTHDTEAGIRCDAEDVLFDKETDDNLSDSHLIQGINWRHRIPLDRMAGTYSEVTLATLGCDLKQREIKMEAEVELSSSEQLARFLTAQDEVMDTIAAKVIDSGASLVATSGEIEKGVLHRLAAAGILVISDLDDKQVRHLSIASGATLVEHIDDLSPSDLGNARNVVMSRNAATDEVRDKIVIDGCEGPLVTIVVGGTIGSEETIRGMYDALKATSIAIQDGRLINGAGYSHAIAAAAVRDAAEGVGDRTRLGMEAYARALEGIPWMLASNAGVEALDSQIALRAAVRGSDTPQGILVDGSVGDVSDVVEPVESLLHGITVATETTCSLLRIDQVISARGD